MAEAAAHLVDRVLPYAPVRQWVLSVPWGLRFAMARDPRLCRAVARAFLRAVSSSYRRRARRELGPARAMDSSDAAAPLSARRIQAGAVNFVQRFSSALALNVHCHALFLDGVHVLDGVHAAPRFVPAPDLDDV